MESPVVLDKPPEYTTANERGFPFEEEEGAGAWSELAARHPDIAARLRQRPATATWARKRRPSSQDADDFGDNFGGFDRFPFDDIPPEFRDHFPTHWNRRFGRDDPNQPPPQAQHPQQPQHPQHQPPQQAAATQTEQEPQAAPEPQTLPQYGLRNTVDLGQKSPADPSLVDADERGQRSMSAPPEGRVNQPRMSEQQQPRPEPAHPSNVRVIPIVVEGRDEPVINKNVDHGAHFTEPKPHPPHDREQYFEDPYGQEGSAPYVPPANFTRAFGTPYGKFRQGPQPFVHQKVFPQSATAFGRAGSPQRSQSPKHPDEHYVKVPVHHEPGAPRPQPQQKPQQPQPQQRQQQQQQQQQPPQQRPQPQQPQQPPQPPQPPKAQTPPPKQTSPADPITTILAIQTDVLNLMTDVENFTGTKNDKGYLFLDEMLTRNLIKLDNIETEGKENIRLARREAIKCIQKCISVLEAKAESNSQKGGAQEAELKEEGAPQEVEMQEAAAEKATENGEVEMTEAPKEEAKEEAPAPAPAAEAPAAPAAADTRPADAPQQNSETKSDQTESKPEQVEVDKTEVDKNSPKKGAKNVKKRDKSKDNKDSTKDSNSVENVDSQGDAGQVASQGDKPMEVDAPSQ